MVLTATVNAYTLMSGAEVEAECKRLETMQHKYASRGLIVMASTYAGKLVTATLILASKELQTC